MNIQYMTVGSLRGGEGVPASRVVVAAEALTRLLAEGQNFDTAFPVAVASVAGIAGESMQVAATRLLNLPQDQRTIVLKAGFEALQKTFGSDTVLLNFFRQQGAAAVEFAFERSGEPRYDSVLSACNRSSLLATKAVRIGGSAAEDYVAFMCSVQRSLDHAVQAGEIRAADASALRTRIEEAAYIGQTDHGREVVMGLQLRATQQYMDDARQSILGKYANALRAGKASPAPSLH